MDKTLNYVEYKIFINKQKYDLSDIEGKIKFTKEIAKTLGDLKSPIEKDVYIDKISKKQEYQRSNTKRDIRKEL